MSENVAYWREQGIELHGRAMDVVKERLSPHIPDEAVRHALALGILKELAEISALRDIEP